MAEEDASKKEGGGDGEFWMKIAAWGMVAILIAFLGLLAFTNLPTVASLLMLGIGVGGAVSVLLFFWGLGLYFIRLGNEYRSTGIHIMQWGVTVLFVVMLLGAALRFVDRMLA